jgi:hypothetical protein
MINKNLTFWQLYVRGQLTVNLPVIMIVSITTFLLNLLVFSNSRISLAIAFVLGWLYWRSAASKWVLWASRNNTSQERIYTVGKSGLLIWSKQFIADVIEKNKQPWV